jgi:hypothetical protein
MDFWNDNTAPITEKKWKMWIQKIHQVSVKIKNKNKASSNEELISEMQWIFHIYIYIL